MTITIIAGARPNFMKIAPIIEAIQQKQSQGIELTYQLLHTGQHYDKNLSHTFFEDLNIPFPDVKLNVQSGTQAEQTAAIMIGFEKFLTTHATDLVMVVGDVTSTMACTIVAKKAGIKVAHVEAGIRSGDLSMPEEINRIVTDSLTDYFFTTTTLASKTLLQLGTPESRIFFVGNVMIDTLRKNEHRLQPPALWQDLKLEKKKYMVMTLHRPSNVDQEHQLRLLITQLAELGKEYPIIFPVHPRTKKLLQGLNLKFDNLHFVRPLGYLEFNFLVKHAFAVLTDSGGITEETTVMDVPCITLRTTTERPETCTLGTNELVGTDPVKISAAFDTLLAGNWKKGAIPDLWDGHAAQRIIDHLVEIYGMA